MAGRMELSDTAALEQLLNAAQQITHIGSWEWEVASGAVRWTDELYRIYGVPPRSVPVTLQWFLQRLHPADRERVGGEIARAVERGGRFGYRERIVRPDGSVRELDTVGEVLAGGGRVIGTCRDITEERRLEESARLNLDVVWHLQIGLAVWRFDAPGDAASLRLVACNPAASAADLGLAGAVGKPLTAIFPPHSRVGELLASVSEATPVRQFSAFRFGNGPGARTFAVKAFALPDQCVGLAFEDVSARAMAELLQAGERRVLEMLAAGGPLAEILDAAARLIEEASPGTMASIQLLDESGRLRHTAAPSLPDAFNRQVDGLVPGPSVGSCGTAVFRRALVVVTDTETDPLWSSYRIQAREAGLRACWSQPIFSSDGAVMGTFALYHRQVQRPDAEALELIGRAAHVVSIVVERRQLDAQLAALSGRLEAAREDERTGIARELHDELGQALTALKMDLAWVERRLGSGEAREKLQEIKRSTDDIIDSVRRISSELRPGLLDDLGLAAALEWLAEEFERRAGVRCTVQSELGDRKLDRAPSTATFRIVQEALTNVARHASASRVEVRLWLEPGRLRLEVRDDGVGLPDHPARRGSLGILGMRERARRLGGVCSVRAAEPRGTLVSLDLPLPA